MRDRPPTIRRALVAAAAAMVAGLGVLSLFVGFSTEWPLRVLEALSVFGLGVVVIGAVAVLALVRLGGWRESDAEFEQLVQRAERLAAQDAVGEIDIYSTGDEFGDPYGEAVDDHFPFAATDRPRRRIEEPDDELDFERLVRAAVGSLPMKYHIALEHVEVVIDDGGAAAVGPGRDGSGRKAVYGRYQGDPVAHELFQDRILIFRDALVRDLGHDPRRLREAVARTVRAELSQHL
jgi:predicted Zn-dependent protease with MMP-like domain